MHRKHDPNEDYKENISNDKNNTNYSHYWG